MLEVDCEVAAGTWDAGVDWKELAHGAISAALDGVRHLAAVHHTDVPVEVVVRLSDDAEIQRLNQQYRGKDKPTNILSFPMLDACDIAEALRNPPHDLLLGDLVLAAETCLREATDKRIRLQDHVTHLLVHGTLHIMGHDHQNDTSAEIMESLEVEILRELGIADPYAEQPQDCVAGAGHG